MKRHLRTAAVLLACGFILNLAVAITCAAASHDCTYRTQTTSACEWLWPMGRATAFLPDMVTDFQDFGVRYEFRRYARDHRSTLDTLDGLYDIRQSRVRAGWPWLSMEARFVRGIGPTAHSPPQPFDLSEHIRIRGLRAGVEFHDIVRHGHWTSLTIPLVPRPLASLGNSLLFALVVGALWMGPPLARRARRRRRGLCVKCKYELKTLAICPECGTPNAAQTRWNRPATPATDLH